VQNNGGVIDENEENVKRRLAMILQRVAGKQEYASIALHIADPLCTSFLP
jgi:hypothetical protein